MFKLVLSLSCLLLFSGCVNQYPETNFEDSDNLKIVATSTAIVEIANRLDLDLVGVPKSEIYTMPTKYSDVQLVGSPMSPDMEIIAQLKPDIVLSPISLMNDLTPKYQASNLNYGFIDLKSIDGMFNAIDELGELFNKQAEAKLLIDEHQKQLAALNMPDYSDIDVLLLMGLPGSYVVATNQSYAGSILELMGLNNVYQDDNAEFLNINPEDMLNQKPDIILRTAHAMPEDVMAMFADEFKTNDIWQHFEAVQNNQVYDLPSEYFGMSATFDYLLGIEYLVEILEK